MKKVIMHIDVNNAFLSWTAIYLLRNGSKYDIRESYAVIGGDETRRSGIVLAKSMSAKRLGIKTGDTLYSARKKCKVLRTYPPNFEFYCEMSKKLFDLIGKYTPDIEIASVDECYLDYTKVKNMYGDELSFATTLQKEIFDQLGFTVNIGIANNKLCAKMASDFTKPYKIHTLYDYEIQDKMWPLPVGKLFGIGKKTAHKLQDLNINTIEDLAKCDSLFLYKYFKNQASVMIDKANGIDNSLVVSTSRDPKGIGNEITLKHDVYDIDELCKYLLFLSDKVSARIRSYNKYASVVVVILKDNNFRRYSHQKKLGSATNLSSEIYSNAKTILNEMYNDEPIRLIGVRLDKLSDHKLEQVSIFDKSKDVDLNIDKVVDSINLKYGGVLKKASLLGNVIDKKYK